MKYLEIQDGVAIKIESIDKVEKIDELNCRLFCGFEAYNVTLPYSIIMDIVNREENKSDNTQVLQEISQKVGSLPIFAG